MTLWLSRLVCKRRWRDKLDRQFAYEDIASLTARYARAANRSGYRSDALILKDVAERLSKLGEPTST